MDATTEWNAAFRSARNAALAWALVIATALLLAPTVVGRFGVDGEVTYLVATFCVAFVAYGVVRMSRLLLARREIRSVGLSLGRVYVVLLTNPMPKNWHELVAVWRDDPRRPGPRTRRPDRIYMADLSEDDAIFSERPRIREAWTAVRADGLPRRGRWFATADNLVLTMRRGGPFARLSIVRGVTAGDTITACARPDVAMTPVAPQPIGFRGLGKAVFWRALGAALFALLAAWGG